MADQFSEPQKSPSPSAPYGGQNQGNNGSDVNALGFSKRRDRVVSQLSNVTNSPARPGSGRSSNSEYSRMTSPLDYKLTVKDKTQNKTTTSLNESPSKDLHFKLKSNQLHKSTNRKSLSNEFSDQQQQEKRPGDQTDPEHFSNVLNDKGFSDGLGSPGSDLEDFEEFDPGSSIFPSSKDDLTENSLFNESTQHIVDRAVSLKYDPTSINNPTTTTNQFDDDLPIGVKKERSVIDSLKQEIFQLKLHIVLMETQLNNSSNTGVAQLKSKLAESEAARIAMKNENEKLRNTNANLGRRRSENFDSDATIDDQIHDLEEELLAYETALGDAQEEQQLIKEYYEKELNQRDSEISELQEVNEDLSNRAMLLEERNEELLQMIADGDDMNEPKTPITPKIKDSAVSNFAENNQLEDLLMLANGIKEKLAISPLQRTTPNQSPSSNVSKKSNVETFQDVLKQIFISVNKFSEDYRTLLSSSKGLQADYDAILDAYKILKSDLDNFVLRTEAETAIEEVENLLFEKEQELETLKNERSELWNNIKLVNEGLEEIELERNNLIELNTQLADKNEELTNMAISQDPLMEEIDKLSRDNTDLRDALEEKDNELQVLSVEYSNCETDLEIKTKEVKKLQDLIKSLRSGTTPVTSSEPVTPESPVSNKSDTKSVVINPKARKSDSDDIVEYFLSGIKQFYNKDTDIDNLTTQFDELIESVKQFDEIAVQLQEASKVNTDLTNMVEERETMLSDLTECVKAGEKKEKEINDELATLTKQLQEKTAEHKRLQEEVDVLKNKAASHNELQEKFDALEKKTEDYDKLHAQLLVLQEKSDECCRLEKELSGMKNQREEEVAIMEQTELMMETIKVELDHLKRELLASTSEKEILHSRIAHLEEELEDANVKNKESDATNEDIAKLHKTLMERGTEIETLQGRIKTLETELESQVKLNRESQRQIEELEETVKSLEIDLEAETALRAELTQTQQEYDSLAEDLELLQTENLDLETRNSELSSELAQLETDFDRISRGKGDYKELKGLRSSVMRLESAERRNLATIRELESKLNELNVSTVQKIKKSSTLDDIARMITQQQHQKHQQKEPEVTKSSSMSKLLSPAVTATIAATGGKPIGVTGTGIGVSSIFKQQAYQHMLDLQKEVQSLRDREKRLSETRK
jgi:myosin protein heavy chain